MAKREKILVVDDEKMIRQLIAKYAVFDGYEVAEAENGTLRVEKVTIPHKVT